MYRRSPYTWAGLGLLIAAMALFCADFFIFHRTWLMALSVCMLILSFILFVLGRAVPNMPPEVCSLLLETGIDNIATLIEELGITTKAIYLPSSLSANQPRAFLPLHSNGTKPQIYRALPQRLICRYGANSEDIGLLISTIGSTATRLLDQKPGDQMKDIDWKHTLRLNQLIIKDYSPDEDTAAIIAVNLSVADEEEADSLAYNLITTALTLARDSIPSTLTAYNNEGVVLATGVNNPDITLRHTLSLIKDINRVESIPRHLDPADISVIKRNISQLKQVDTEPSRQLLAILGFEYQSIEESTRKHPATVALTGTAKQVVGPATILLVSQLNHDAEAIKVTTDKLSRKMFNTIRVSSPAEVIPQ